MTRFVEEHLAELADTLIPFREEAAVLEDWGARLARILSRGGRLLVAGNGGSAAEAQHLTAELVGKLRHDRMPLSAIALHADTSSLTAIGNDYGYGEVFARQVRAHGRPGDVLLLMSTSGRSPNLLAAGGAGLAAALATDLGVEVTLIAPVPDDAGGARLRALLDEAGVRLCALPIDGPMPEKIRIRTAGHTLMRVDQSGAPAPVPERLPTSAAAVLRAATGVLVSDYGRGITAMADLRTVLTEVARRKPVVWDPHPRGSDPVPGIRLATPNEAELAHQVPPCTGAG